MTEQKTRLTNVYSQDVMICATVYVKASSKDEAAQIVRELKDRSPAIHDSDGDVEVSGLALDNPDLPDVSFSPAMSICEPVPNTKPELQEENVEVVD